MTAETQETALPRKDLLILSQNPSFNMVEPGLRALMNFVHTANIARATDEAVAKTWVEIYAVPGATPHEAFVRHGYDLSVPPFLELVVHNALTPERGPWGGDEAVRFWLEFRGALFDDLDGRFKNRLREVLNTRLDLRVRPHTALPPHREVPPGEEAVAVKRHRQERASLRVGTAVEEF
jgi:hypothetical protein